MIFNKEYILNAPDIHTISKDIKDILFDRVVIVPTKEVHDSGYLIMRLVFCYKDEIICSLNSSTDVLELGGIGGRCYYTNKVREDVFEHKGGYCIDVFPGGYVSLFNWRYPMRLGAALSTTELIPEIGDKRC